MSSKPFAWSARNMRDATASQGRRMSAPIIGGSTGDFVKELDESGVGMYRQVTLLLRPGGCNDDDHHNRGDPHRADRYPLPRRSGGDGRDRRAVRFDVPTGGPAPPAHSHDSWEETIYGLSGTLTWTVDGVATAVGPGEVLCIPRGVVHGFENLGTEVATQLAVVTPGRLGPDYFRELAALTSDGPPDPAAMRDVMRRHGLTPAARRP